MRVLISINSPVQAWRIPGEHVSRIRERFPDISLVHATTDAEMRDALPDAVVLFGHLSSESFRNASRLRWIHSPAAGIGNLLFPALVESAVLVTNSRGLQADAIAEHVLGVILALRRKLPMAVARQSAHQWAQNEMFRPPSFKLLRGSGMGIVGAGAIGSAIGRLAAAVGMRVVALRRNPFKGRPEGVETVLPPSELGQVLADSDIVVLAAPLTEETRHQIGASEIRRMKPDALLVNVARGKLVNEAELIDELRRGTIGGAALDVFEHEPLDADSPLWDLPNVLITPHTAGFRQENWDLTTDLFCDNLERFRDGRPLLCEVDKQAGY